MAGGGRSQVTTSDAQGTAAATTPAYNAFQPAAMSAPVTVAVQPDAPPTVAIFSSRDGSQVVEGSTVTVVAGASDLGGSGGEGGGAKLGGQSDAPLRRRSPPPPGGWEDDY